MWVLWIAMEAEASPVRTAWRAILGKDAPPIEAAWPATLADVAAGRSAEWWPRPGGGRMLALVGGIGEHSAAAALARAVAHGGLRAGVGAGAGAAGGDAVDVVVNFGAVGAYEDAPHVAALGALVRVAAVVKWDLHVPLPGFEPHMPHVALADHPALHDLAAVVCATGASFSDPRAREAWAARVAAAPALVAGSDADADVGAPARERQPGALRADVEDMELYAAACVCAALGLPLVSLKFVSNWCNANGARDFEEQMPRVLPVAVGRLVQMLLADPLPRGPAAHG